MDIPNRANPIRSRSEDPGDRGSRSWTELLVAAWLAALMVVGLLAVA